MGQADDLKVELELVYEHEDDDELVDEWFEEQPTVPYGRDVASLVHFSVAASAVVAAFAVLGAVS